MPLHFSNDYLTGDSTWAAGTRTLDMTSPKLGYQVECMNSSSNNAPWNTHLAAPLKAAARVLLGKSGTDSGITNRMNADRNKLTDNAPVSKWIIFETDGQPAETMDANNNTLLNNDVDPSAPGNPSQACTNLIDVATRAKNTNNGIHIIMIAFGSGTTTKCIGNETVRDAMAAAASPRDFNAATPSTAPKDCATANSDGDYFYCATTGDELSTIFTNVMGRASASTTKFVRMPT